MKNALCLLATAAALAGACSHASTKTTAQRERDMETAATTQYTNDSMRTVAAVAPPASAQGTAGCGASSVYFETGSSELDDADRQQLQSLARCLEQRDIDTLYVVGRTDPAGTDAFNLALGQRRATAVADYLRSTGLSANFVIRTRGEQGASSDRVLWPMQRAADAQAATSASPR